LMEEIKPDSGTLKWGQTVSVSYFPQNTTDLVKGDNKLYDWIQAHDPKWHIDEIRKCLGRMLFTGEEQIKVVDSCSGGEKHRMMLSKMMMDSANFLVLDEPNNHLDLEALSLWVRLYMIIKVGYCVTHDRELIDALQIVLLRYFQMARLSTLRVIMKPLLRLMASR